jgi:hypothetical protein
MNYLVMLQKRIERRIVGEIAPDRMNMIGLILGAVVFSQGGCAKQLVVMALSTIGATGPNISGYFQRSGFYYSTLRLSH